MTLYYLAVLFRPTRLDVLPAKYGKWFFLNLKKKKRVKSGVVEMQIQHWQHPTGYLEDILRHHVKSGHGIV